MKKFLCLLFAGALLPAHAQITLPAPSPMCKVEQKVGLSTVNIEYSRPGKKDRIVFGDLVPYGQMWRTGANMATKISFSDEIMFEEVKVPKGSYALFTIPGEEEWDVILYADANVGGVPQNYDPAKEVAHVKVVPELIPFTFETFIIDINEIRNESAKIYMMWETTLVPIKLRYESDAAVMANIDKVLSGPSSNDYYSAARYYFDTGKSLDKAYEFCHKANELAPTFWKVRLEALILAQMGKYPEAIATAEKSKAMAIEAKNDEYVRLNNASITEWSTK